MMVFKVKAERINQYGMKETMIATREAKNAWQMSEELRKEGWTNNIIREIN